MCCPDHCENCSLVFEVKKCQRHIFQCLASNALEVEATLSKTRYISAMAESCINRGALPKSRATRSSSSPKGRRRRRRSRRSSDLALGVLTQAAKSGSFFFLNSDRRRKVVSEIVKTGYVPSPDQELATFAVAAAAGM